MYIMFASRLSVYDYCYVQILHSTKVGSGRSAVGNKLMMPVHKKEDGVANGPARPVVGR